MPSIPLPAIAVPPLSPKRKRESSSPDAPSLPKDSFSSFAKPISGRQSRATTAVPDSSQTEQGEDTRPDKKRQKQDDPSKEGGADSQA